MGRYLAVLKKYAVFSGRAGRQEFWMFILINFVVSIVINVVEGAAGSPGIIGGLYTLGILLPAIGVAIRRLHDTGRSAWWLLMGLIPILGAIALIVFYATGSEPRENRYGPEAAISID